MNVLKRRLFEAKALSPGETAAVTGVYRVVHVEHRADHEVIAISGDMLPACRACKGAVRFYLQRSIDYVTHDWDLAGPVIFINASK